LAREIIPGARKRETCWCCWSARKAGLVIYLKKLLPSWRLGLSIGEVYGVASFYSFLSVKPQGRNVIRVCQSLPCYLKDSQLIIDSVRKAIGIKPGETSADGRFSFELTNCIGACDRAPAMMINDDVHVDLTPPKIAKILEGYK
jgi:NADH-quinone oxidoreductase subunit E